MMRRMSVILERPDRSPKPLLRVLTKRAAVKANGGKGADVPSPPVWFMRQAGRYLPEYRKVREKAGGFLNLAYRPDLAVEVTMQPIRRYGFDAAILFSDILVVPHALGQGVRFAEGEGPVLDRLDDRMMNLNTLLADRGLDAFHRHLEPVYAAVSGIRYGLKAEGFENTALIGFAGAPWTVACYMVEGGGSKEFARTRTLAMTDAKVFESLINGLVVATTGYLLRQIRAGAEVVQIFDSWAGLLPPDQFRRWVIEPTRAIVSALHAQAPHVPVIGFPRGAGLMIEEYIVATGVDAVSLDERVPPLWARTRIQPSLPVQGNLDPFALLCGGDVLARAVDGILDDLGHAPFVFNLGHGINKDTPPQHVADAVGRIRNWRGVS